MAQVSRSTAATGAAASWVADEFGIVLQDNGSPVGLRMAELIEVGLRRNPRRAQLLVSTVLGKHLAADPRAIVGVGRLLGALVGRTLDGTAGPVPASWPRAARETVSGEDPAALTALLDEAPPVVMAGVLTFGFAETATSLGHLVADQLCSPYLHSTRRRDGDVPVAAEFSEPHSHATGHLLRPDPPDLLTGDGPIVLVDDELSTGRTALNVIEALHEVAPRSRYVLAGLVDVRSEADDGNRVAVERRLGCRIDVVSLVQGEIVVPAGVVDRVAAELEISAGTTPGSTERAGEPPLVELPWPADLPTGGRHGFRVAHRQAFDEAIHSAASVLAAAIGPAQRVLVLGTEELMYLPLRLALALAMDPLRQVVFQSTTRSPVHAIDRPGYPVRRRIDFRSRVIDPGPDEPDSVLRHVYNVCWPAGGGRAGGDGAALREADLIVVVDDGHAWSGRDGVAESIAAATGAPVVLAVLTPRPDR
jgi:hypothetical protein